MLSASQVTLGILAGGRATRLDGRDKAWLTRGGTPQVLRIARRFGAECSSVCFSANRDLDAYVGHGLNAVSDRYPDIGPMGGMDALLAACRTAWLLTLPVDVVELALRRYEFNVKPISAAVAADQQRIADTFFELKLIPKPIKVSDAIVRAQP